MIRSILLHISSAHAFIILFPCLSTTNHRLWFERRLKHVSDKPLNPIISLSFRWNFLHFILYLIMVDGGANMNAPVIMQSLIFDDFLLMSFATLGCVLWQRDVWINKWYNLQVIFFKIACCSRLMYINAVTWCAFLCFYKLFLCFNSVLRCLKAASFFFPEWFPQALSSALHAPWHQCGGSVALKVAGLRDYTVGWFLYTVKIAVDYLYIIGYDRFLNTAIRIHVYGLIAL